MYLHNLPKQDMPTPASAKTASSCTLATINICHLTHLPKQDMLAPGSANTDPVFSGNKLVNSEVGYPGIDPLGFSKGDMPTLKLKEIKNGRLAMLAFAGFAAQVRTHLCVCVRAYVCDMLCATRALH